LLGDYLRLDSESRVLDVACGKAGPATILASTYGCRILGIEVPPAFADDAQPHRRGRSRAAGRDPEGRRGRGRARAGGLGRGALPGASFVWGTIAEAAKILHPAVRAGGFAAIGEPFWRDWPLPERVDAEDYVGLEATVARFEAAAFATTGVIAASEDDWDRYESLHWRALEEWLAGHDEPEIRARHEAYRSKYLAYQRALLGWAIFVGRKL
jgi:hypothetical protein